MERQTVGQETDRLTNGQTDGQTDTIFNNLPDSALIEVSCGSLDKYFTQVNYGPSKKSFTIHCVHAPMHFLVC